MLSFPANGEAAGWGYYCNNGMESGQSTCGPGPYTIDDAFEPGAGPDLTAAAAACGMPAISQAANSQGQSISLACEAGSACIAALNAAYSTTLNCGGGGGGGGGGGSSVPVAAIAGGAVGGVLILGVAGYLLMRRKSSGAAKKPPTTTKADISDV